MMTIHHLVTGDRSLAPSSPPGGLRSLKVRGVGVAILVVALLLMSATGSGRHRDESHPLETSHHSPWGYVGRLHVPVVLQRLGRTLFEESLVGLRLPAAVVYGAIGLVESHPPAVWKLLIPPNARGR